jgi:hypothetical protein
VRVTDKTYFWMERVEPEESTRLVYTGFLGEHLKAKTRLIDEKLASVMGDDSV